MYIDIQGTKLHYEIEGHGTPIIIIHGKGIDYRTMKGCLEPYFKDDNNYKRIYFDLPGMGLTKLEDNITSWNDFKNIIIKAMEKLIGQEACLLIGESYGGHLVRGVLSEKALQVKGVAYICPVIEESTEILPELKAIVSDKDINWEEEQYASFISYAIVRTKEVFERFQKDVLPGVELYDENVERLGTMVEIDYEAIYDKPALFIVGRQDSIVGYEGAFNLLSKYPRATYSVLDSGGHCIQMENVEMFEMLIKDWLRRVEQE